MLYRVLHISDVSFDVLKSIVEHFRVSHHGFADFRTSSLDLFGGCVDCSICLSLIDSLDETVRLSDEFRLFLLG